MKCYLKKKKNTHTRFSTQATRKLFVGFFPPDSSYLPRSLKRVLCVCVFLMLKKNVPTSVPLFFHSLFCLNFTEARFLSQKTEAMKCKTISTKLPK